jgi:hypothetical protein
MDLAPYLVTRLANLERRLEPRKALADRPIVRRSVPDRWEGVEDHQRLPERTQLDHSQKSLWEPISLRSDLTSRIH